VTDSDPKADRATRILIGLDTLLIEDPAAPRPTEDAQTALERLAWIGRPVVLAGAVIAGRKLPVDPDERAAWVRAILHADDLSVASFDEMPVERAGDAADRLAVDRWLALRDAWRAGRLITRHDGSVGPARRAGLEVIRIGPRSRSTTATIERPDVEARDLLDAVSRLLAHDAFAAPSAG
jgi:hypothetical protein